MCCIMYYLAIRRISGHKLNFCRVQTACNVPFWRTACADLLSVVSAVSPLSAVCAVRRVRPRDSRVYVTTSVSASTGSHRWRSELWVSATFGRRKDFISPRRPLLFALIDGDRTAEWEPRVRICPRPAPAPAPARPPLRRNRRRRGGGGGETGRKG